jgi:hypothetical protein
MVANRAPACDHVLVMAHIGNFFRLFLSWELDKDVSSVEPYQALPPFHKAFKEPHEALRGIIRLN